MFNKSEIMKQAHGYARAYRSSYPGKTYRELFAWGLAAYWKIAKETASEKLDRVSFEHKRRNISDRHYFGSEAAKRNQSQIDQLKRAA